VCRAVLEDETPRFTGRFYQVDGAVNRPAPVQPGGVPIVVLAGPGVPVRPDLLRVAGHFADAVIVEGDPASVAEAVALLAEAAGSAGRAPGSVQVIWKGRPDRSADEVSARLAAGADGCIVAPADRSGGDRLEAIARLGSLLRGAVDPVPARAGTRRA
jgi:alkanesulfonate monooxygenase SsuD/methylene tetrahydromethanopterin reductase-like flavin-dependent oxidoreductase (luciferase family)